VRVTTTTRIDCAPQQVFDTLADLRNDLKWNSRVSSAELQTAEPIGAGTRFTIVNGGTPYDASIAVYEPPAQLVIEAAGKPDLTIAYTLTANGNGTKLESDFDFRPPGALKVLFWLLAPIIRRDARKQFGSLKALCESA